MVLEHLCQTERSVTGLLSKLFDQASPRTADDADDFAPSEFLRHIDMPRFLDRTRKVTGSQPSGVMSAAQAWEDLRESRRALLAVLRQSTGLRLEGISFTHPLGPVLDGYRWFAFVGLHESRHAAQIREILTQVGPRSGQSQEG
jgi:hypothetical protein